ncbi:MAG: hypothetical protein ABSD49_14180 [Candidatus Bathyarchaeia archaeon]
MVSRNFRMSTASAMSFTAPDCIILEYSSMLDHESILRAIIESDGENRNAAHLNNLAVVLLRKGAEKLLKKLCNYLMKLFDLTRTVVDVPRKRKKLLQI